VLSRRHGGARRRIVNIVADIWGSMPGMGHSGAARAGMVSFTETAALEWASSGVRVNAVAPGYIASSGMDHYPPEAAAMLRQMPRRCRWAALATRPKFGRHCVFAQPGGQFHQRHGAAHGRRAAAGAHGLGPGGGA
jgi:citronellol/citronellal dehydrogenase